MEKRFLVFGIIGAVVIMLGGVLLFFAFGSGGGGSDDEIPPINSFPEETANLLGTGIYIDEREGLYYWNIAPPGNNTNYALISNVKVTITWSDDEDVGRPMYVNNPDSFRVTINVTPIQGNDTKTVNRDSDSGTVTANLNFATNPAPVECGDEALEILPDPENTQEVSEEPGLFIYVSCDAGDHRATRPALLLYNDFGDEIDISITLTYKQVPKEVYEYWNAPTEG